MHIIISDHLLENEKILTLLQSLPVTIYDQSIYSHDTYIDEKDITLLLVNVAVRYDSSMDQFQKFNQKVIELDTRGNKHRAFSREITDEMISTIISEVWYSTEEELIEKIEEIVSEQEN